MFCVLVVGPACLAACLAARLPFCFCRFGLDSVTTFVALAAAIWIFQRYLLNSNWRNTQYASNIFTAVLGLQWLLAFYDVGGLLNPWYTILINTNQVGQDCQYAVSH